MKLSKENLQNKTVAILLHGSSINSLKEHPEVLADKDWIFCSLNYFKIMEDEILSKVNKKLDIVYCSSNKSLLNRKADLDEFIKGDVTFVTSFEGMWQTNNEDFVNENSEKVKFAEVVKYAGDVSPNSLAVFMLSLIKWGARRIILFGADGLLFDNASDIGYIKTTYFGKEKLEMEDRDWNLIDDTQHFNMQFFEYLINNLGEEVVDQVKIVNCSPNSHFVPFKKMDYSKIDSFNFKDFDLRTTGAAARETMIEQMNECFNSFKNIPDFESFVNQLRDKYRVVAGTNSFDSIIADFRVKLKQKLGI